MSFKEVKELRKSGKLEEALQIAKTDLENAPDDIWNKRSIAWVYYDYIKHSIIINQYDIFIKFLNKIKELELPAEEVMIFDSCAFQIGKMIFLLKNEREIDYRKINEIYEIVKGFSYTKPSDAYSFLYKAFHKVHKGWAKYIEFADWWCFDNFQEKDFLSEEYNGQEILPLVEQAYVAYAKGIIKENGFDLIAEFNLSGKERFNDTELKKIDEAKKKRISDFIEKLNQLAKSNPEFKYTLYYKVKLLLLLGDREDAFNEFLPFAQKNRNQFWVWSLLSELITDKIQKIACLCKALTIKTPAEFLIGVREEFTKVLIKQELYEEAKTEISQIIEIRKNKNWKVSNEIKDWTEYEWYKKAEKKKNNNKLYESYKEIAEEILFSNILEEIAVVEFVNRNKKILSFIISKEKFGFFRYGQNLSNIKIGDILKIRVKNKNKNFYELLTARKLDDNTELKTIKKFEGRIKIISKLGFGFVDEVFINRVLIENNQINQNDKIIGKAIMSFNKKKKEWGWKAFVIKSELSRLADDFGNVGGEF